MKNLFADIYWSYANGFHNMTWSHQFGGSSNPKPHSCSQCLDSSSAPC